MRRAIVFGLNLVAGAALLGWVLSREGGAALALLARDVSPLRLAAFAGAMLAIVVSFAWRWRHLLEGVGRPPPLLPLTAFRAAGQSLSALIPSAKLGGDPLRAWLAARSYATAPHAIASVAVDRALEIGAAAPFSVVFAVVLVQQGVPQLRNALVTVLVGAAAVAAAGWITGRRLSSGEGLVTAFARRTGLDSFGLVERRMDVLARSEEAAATLVAGRSRLLAAYAAGLGSNLLVLLEFHFLLSAFGLPADAVSVVAALFATAASHQLPVPAGIGVLEGGQMWLFGMLGHPPEVGLAVGLAVRLREIVWIAPGLLYLWARRLNAAAQAA